MTSIISSVGSSLPLVQPTGSASPSAAGLEATGAEPLLRRRLHGAIRPIRRILFIGKSKSTSGTTRAIVDGLRTTGVHVQWINCARLQRMLGRRLMRRWVCRTFERLQPDLLVTFYCDIPPDLLAAFHSRCTTMMWNEEWNGDPARNMRPWLERIDLMCLNNKQQADVYRSVGAGRVEFVMSGFSPRVHYPAAAPRHPLYDVCYIGSMSEDNPRAELILKVAEQYDLHVFGRGWEPFTGKARKLHVHGRVDPRQFARVCARSRIMLGANWINTVPFYFSNRTWMTLGSRAFHLTHYVPGLEDVFENRRHLVWYDDVREMLELIRAYLPDVAGREQIAQQGYELVRSRHTYGHRMRHVLGLLGQTADADGAASASSPSHAPAHSPSHSPATANGTAMARDAIGGASVLLNGTHDRHADHAGRGSPQSARGRPEAAP